MKDYSYVSNAHPEYIDSLYRRYLSDPHNVEEGWRIFFEGFEFNNISDSSADGQSTDIQGLQKEYNVLSLILGYRSRAHLLSDTNPIRKRRDRNALLSIENYGLTETDMDSVFAAGRTIGMGSAKLSSIIEKLRKIYCGKIGFEYAHYRRTRKARMAEEKN